MYKKKEKKIIKRQKKLTKEHSSYCKRQALFRNLQNSLQSYRSSSRAQQALLPPPADFHLLQRPSLIACPIHDAILRFASRRPSVLRALLIHFHFHFSFPLCFLLHLSGVGEKTRAESHLDFPLYTTPVLSLTFRLAREPALLQLYMYNQRPRTCKLQMDLALSGDWILIQH